MAAHNSTITRSTGEVAVHDLTIDASTVDSVTFDRDLDTVAVGSDGAAKLYFTVDGSTPVVGGKHTYTLPSGPPSARKVSVPSAGNTVVKLLSAGTPTYGVQDGDTYLDLQLGGPASVSVGSINHGLTPGVSVSKNVTTAGTKVQLDALACKWLLVTARPTNTKQVNIGDSSVVATSGGSTGVPLLPGDRVWLPCSNANQWYIDSQVNGEGVVIQPWS